MKENKIILILAAIVAVLAVTTVVSIHSLTQMSKRASYHMKMQTALEDVIEDIDDTYFTDVIVESDAYQNYLEERGY